MNLNASDLLSRGSRTAFRRLVSFPPSMLTTDWVGVGMGVVEDGVDTSPLPSLELLVEATSRQAKAQRPMLHPGRKAMAQSKLADEI